jgi:hypothetical protein
MRVLNGVSVATAWWTKRRQRSSSGLGASGTWLAASKAMIVTIWYPPGYRVAVVNGNGKRAVNRVLAGSAHRGPCRSR